MLGSFGSVCGKLWRLQGTWGSSAHQRLPILLDTIGSRYLRLRQLFIESRKELTKCDTCKYV